MAAFNFPLNPLDGQQYPNPAIPGVNVYNYNSAYNTWSLIGKAGYNQPGTYGDNVTCLEVTVTLAGTIANIVNKPIPDVTNTQKGLLTPGIGLNVVTAGIVDLLPPLGSNIGGVKQGSNITIASDGSVSVASATTAIPGIVQLNDTTSSSSTTQALTASAGKALQDQINALIVDALIFCGTYNASTSQMDYVTNEGGVKGFVVGQNIPTPTNALNGSFVIVSVPGTPSSPAPTQPVGSGDWIVCDIAPPQWVVVPIGRFIVASQVIFNPYNYVTATNVQTAIQEVVDRTNFFNLASGTGLSGGPFTLSGGSQTVSLLPPTATVIGGVKAGTNIVIAADGTISALGGGSGTITGVTAGLGLTGGGVSGVVTLDVVGGTGITVDVDSISISNTTVTPGSYSYPTLTVNAQGQLTAASSNTAVSNFTAGAGLSTTGGTGSITVNLIPPTSTVIGGVKAGTNVTIDADGTINVVSGGGVGTITGVTAGAGLTGGGVSGVVTLDVVGGTGITVNADNIELNNTTVTPGTYNFSTITVDQQGRLTAASTGVPVTSVTAGTGLTGGTITSTGTIAVGNTAVTAGSYSYPTLTVNAQGQLTAASSNTAVSNFTAGAGLSTTGSTGSITVNLLPPTATVIGGVKEGTNITIASDGSISLSASGVIAGTYTNPNITVDTYGRITSATNAPIPVPFYIKTIDNVSPLFDGTAVTFSLAIGGVSFTPTPTSNLMVFIGGVAQVPTVSYTLSGDQITFSEAPAAGATFYATTVGTGSGLTTYHITPIDTISPLFNGTATAFDIRINNALYTPSPASNLMVFVGGIAQTPILSYNIVGSQIIFTEAPETNADFYATSVTNL